MKLSDEECEFSTLKKSECAHCLGQTDKSDKPVLDKIVIAQYEGRCSECREPIEPGDHIGVVETIVGDNGDVVRKVWAHYGCGV